MIKLNKILLDENIIRNEIDKLISYCNIILEDKNLFDDFEFSKEEINIHIKFIIDKLNYYCYILENIINKQVEIEYKEYEMILTNTTFEEMFDFFLMKDFHIINSVKITINLEELLD
jgi:hypothetical protein